MEQARDLACISGGGGGDQRGHTLLQINEPVNLPRLGWTEDKDLFMGAGHVLLITHVQLLK